MIEINCTINNICGEHGICKNDQCECIAYWSGEICQTSFKETLGNVFIFWRCLFLILYGSLFAFLLYKLLFYFIKIHPILSLKSASFILLLSNTICRILYLALDPMVQTYLIPAPVTQLLGGLSLYLVFTAYLMVLLHWIGVYHQVFTLRHKIFIPITQRIFIVIDGIWLIFEVSIRIVYGLELSGIIKISNGLEVVDLVYGVYISMVGFIFSFFFLVYGSLIFFKIKDAQFQKKTKEQVFKKLTFIITILSWTFLIATISVILIIIMNGSKTPFGALFSLSAQFIFELILIIEMFYILKRQEKK